MAKSLKQLQAQIAKLEQQAKAIRDKEVVGVISRIREAIAHYDLTPAQLFGGKAATTKTAQRVRTSSPAKFANDQGQTWSGVGKRPDWFKAALASGKTPEELLVDGSSTPAPTKRKAASHKRAGSDRRRGAGKPKYQSGEGQTWTGVGKRPGWFVAALESGKTAEDLLII